MHPVRYVPVDHRPVAPKKPIGARKGSGRKGAKKPLRVVVYPTYHPPRLKLVNRGATARVLPFPSGRPGVTL